MYIINMMNMPQNKLIGIRIKEAREAVGISQKALADAVGFESATAISLIEAGERKVRVEDLEKMAKALERDIKYFIGQEDRPIDVRVAVRATKDLSEKDKNAILRFIELAKKKKHGGS